MQLRILFIGVAIACLCYGCKDPLADASFASSPPVAAKLPSVHRAQTAPIPEALLLEVSLDEIRVSFGRIGPKWRRELEAMVDRQVAAQPWYKRFWFERDLRQDLADGAELPQLPPLSIANGTVPDTMRKGGAGSLYIKPLFAQLVEATQLSKRVARVADTRYDPELIIAADRRLPFETLRAVQYTAMQAELAEHHFLVQKPGNSELQVIRVQLPKLSTCAAPPIPPETPFCAVPYVSLAKEGTYVGLVAAKEVEGCGSSWYPIEFDSKARGPHVSDDDRPAWDRSILVPDARTCPSVPAQAGDSARRVKELIEEYDGADYCTKISLTVADNARPHVTAGQWLELFAELDVIDELVVVYPSLGSPKAQRLAGCPDAVVVD